MRAEAAAVLIAGIGQGCVEAHILSRQLLVLLDLGVDQEGDTVFRLSARGTARSTHYPGLWHTRHMRLDMTETQPLTAQGSLDTIAAPPPPPPLSLKAVCNGAPAPCSCRC